MKRNHMICCKQKRKRRDNLGEYIMKIFWFKVDFLVNFHALGLITYYGFSLVIIVSLRLTKSELLSNITQMTIDTGCARLPNILECEKSCQYTKLAQNPTWLEFGLPLLG